MRLCVSERSDVTWLTPIAGLILAACVIPPLIVLYFLKLRRKPQAISCTLLWKRSVEDLRANAPFQRLRRSLLLLLQLIALALLALSIAQPQIHAGSISGGKTVILIDNSASMTATDPTPGSGGGANDKTRLDEAKRRAKEKIEQLYGGGLFASSAGETMIIVFSDRAEVYQRFTTSKAALLDAIDRIQPTHGETKIAEALKLANAYTTNVVDNMGEARPISNPPLLEIYSDGRIDDLDQQVIRGDKMPNYHAIGSTEADNVSISAISVERPYDRPTAVQVFVALLNFNKEPMKCDMQVSVDSHVVGIQGADVPAAEINETTKQFMPGRSNVVFTPFEQPRNAVIQVANLRADKLAADNVAQVVVPPPKHLKIALVASGRSLIKTALEGMKFELLQEMSGERYEQLAAENGLDAFDVVVLDNYQPKTMPPARYLTFGPTPPVDGLIDFGDGKQQVVLAAKDDHPVLRFVNHENIFISKFRKIQPGTDVQLLWEGSRGPAIVAVARGSMQVIHVTFDPLESNWPFQRSFVTFLYNAVEFLGNAGEAITNKGFAPGEAISTRLPSMAREIRLSMPDSSTPLPLSPQDPTQLAWGPIRLAGVYTLTWKMPDSSDSQTRVFAANLLSENEGRLDVAPTIEIGQDTVSGRRSDEAAYTPLWPWAIGVCLAVLMLEWWVYHRKAFI